MTDDPVLRFWIAPELPPRLPDALVFDHGGFVNGYEGYNEIANPMEGGGALIFYLFPISEEFQTLATCWSGLGFEAVVEWMGEPKTGELVTPLVRRSWPRFSALFARGVDGDFDHPVLTWVGMGGAGKGHWCLLVRFKGPPIERIEQLFEGAAGAALGTLQTESFELLKETIDGPGMIPGLVMALGEGSHARLEQRKGWIGNLNEVLGHVRDAIGG